MSDDFLKEICQRDEFSRQEAFRSAVFQDEKLKPIASKVIWCFFDKWPREMSVIFAGGFVLLVSRQPEGADQEMYSWQLDADADGGKDEGRHGMCQLGEVRQSKGEIELSAASSEKMMRLALRKILPIVRIGGELLSEGSELLTEEEAEKLYGHYGPFVLAVDAEEENGPERAQVWVRDKKGKLHYAGTG